MPQLQLPMFPVGVTHIITALLTFTKEEGNITYFNGSLPELVTRKKIPNPSE